MNACRREFLAWSVGALAARAFGELKVFETGIVDEQVLKVEPLEIPIGLKAPFRAFHFSDTHLNFFDAVDFSAVDRKRKDHFNKRWVRFPQSVSSFYASLDYAAKRNLPLLHTGDLLDYTTDGNIRFLGHNLRGLDLHYAIGNHEYQTRAPEHYDPDPSAPRARLQPHFKNDLSVSSRVMGGINFVAYDDARRNVRAEVIRRVTAEFEKPFPVVLMCHVPPIYTPQFLDNSLAAKRTIMRAQGVDEATLKTLARGHWSWDDFDPPTRAFYETLQRQPKLKAILCGHTHVAETDDFSETARMYVAGGNYEGRAYDITFV